MSHDLFEQCQTINSHLNQGQDAQAREHLIKLLANGREHREHTPLVNHLIRQTGLFPYLKGESIWQDHLVKELFTVDVGNEQPMTLHREQSAVLKELLNGENLLLSAPTSFGKSFIIDALIAIKKPKNILIIVPTIALLDECRRRIFKKFSSSYKIISTAGCALDERNILVLTAERALHYANDLQAKGLDVLIVDEFYKIDSEDERSQSLQLLVSRIEAFVVQRYFLAPNIKQLSNDSFFTKRMKFIEKLDFSTVFLNKTDVFKVLPKGKTKKGNPSKKIDLEAKNNYLIDEVLNRSPKKTLVYAGSYAQINSLSELINSRIPAESSEKLSTFSAWISQNYHANWGLAKLAQKGFGWHNGRLHRSLAQIQIKLFEEPDGLRAILCTSSVIEGVNTQAEQVVLWSNKNGGTGITPFEYKNIMGRAGRMFKYFVGDIYVMEEPPEEGDEEQLNLSLDENSTLSLTVSDEQTPRTRDQISEIIRYKEEMSQLFGGQPIEQLIRDGVFQTADKEFIKKIACDMRDDATSWNGLSNLNNENPTEWERFIKKMIYLAHGKIVLWKDREKFCNFTCALFNHREKEIKELIAL